MSGESTLSAAMGPTGLDHDPPTLVDVSDALGNDMVLLRAIEMGVEGLGKEHDCVPDANSIAELVRTLRLRLEERQEQVSELNDAERDWCLPIAV